LRRIALGGLTFILLACSNSNATSPAANSTTSPAASLAANFVTRLDVLFAEHSFLLAKASEAAVLQLPDYVGYLQLLSANQNDILATMSEAVGNTSATDFSSAWQAVDTDVVQYGVGVVAHDRSMSGRASQDLSQTAVPLLTQVNSEVTGVAASTVSQQLIRWSRSATQMVDDAMAKRYEYFYADLETMFAITYQWGASTAIALVSKYPDKFPGNLSPPAVQLRLAMNLILLTHAYLSTMATDAIASDRANERDPVLSALRSNSEALVGKLSSVDQSSLATVWTARVDAIVAYATSADSKAKSALTSDFVTQFSMLTRAPSAAVGDQAAATVRVIDDQRAKNYTNLPADDRAAASAMQPIADAIAGA
jgi:hypothetical protein